MTPAGRIIAGGRLRPETGLFLDYREPIVWSEIPECPTDEAAAKAMETLWQPFKEFPFAGPAARGAFLAALFTAVLRPVLPTAPGFVISAPTPGTGKTLLAKCLAVLAGDRPEAVTFPKKDEEQRKLLFSLARRGPRAVVFDNITEPVASPALCAFLTSELFTDRVLGVSSTLSVPTNCMILLTGNNFVAVGDLNRRLVRIELDAQCERPFERYFNLDPLVFVRDNRLSLVRAALTILLVSRTWSFLATSSTAGSFEDWSRLVLEAVDFVRMAKILDVVDPMQTIRESLENDPETSRLRGLLHAWYDAFGKKPTTVPDAITMAKVEESVKLRSAFQEVAGKEHGQIDPHRLGRQIEIVQKRIIDGLRFMRCGKHRDRVLWAVHGTM